MRHVAITGASRGLGLALAKRLAGPATRLSICAKDAGRLAQAQGTLAQTGAKVHADPVNLCDLGSTEDWVQTLGDRAPVDTMILNAGAFGGRGEDGTQETAKQAQNLVQTNFAAPIGLAHMVADHMRLRGQGKLVFISSLAAFSPLADAPTYAATKAGLTHFARALREDLAPHGVHILIVHPGHIDTSQTRQHLGPLPGLVSAEQAAAAIHTAIEAGKTDISFPQHLRLGLRLQSVLPWRWQAAINQRLRFRVKADAPEDKD